MPTKEQVLQLVRQGKSYEDAAAALGVTPGLAYMIATGIPADGGDTVTSRQRERPGMERSHTQRLVNAHEVNPTTHPQVADWMRRRAADDAQMQAAAGAAEGQGGTGR